MIWEQSVSVGSSYLKLASLYLLRFIESQVPIVISLRVYFIPAYYNLFFFPQALIYSSYFSCLTRPLVLILDPHILYIINNIFWAGKSYQGNISHMSTPSLCMARSLLHALCDLIYFTWPHSRPHKLFFYSYYISGFNLSLLALQLNF